MGEKGEWVEHGIFRTMKLISKDTVTVDTCHAFWQNPQNIQHKA